MKPIACWWTALLAIALQLSACTSLPPWAIPATTSAKAPSLSTERPQPTVIPAERSVKVRRQLQTLLAREDYARALKLARQEVKHGTRETEFADEYLQAANGSLRLVNYYIALGKHDQAGRLLLSLREGYPQNRDLAAQVDSSPAEIAVKLDLCAEELMAQGLIAYRAGELATAIRTWERILAFSPDHREAANAIRTAELQLSKLKSLDGRP